MINLLPYEEKKIIKSIRKLRILTVVFWGMTILMIIALFLLLPTIFTVNSRYSIVDNQIKKLKEGGSIIDASDIENLNNRITNLDQKLNMETILSPSFYINYIKTLTPKGVIITSFDMDNKNLTLKVEGIYISRVQLQDFLEFLRSSNLIESVDSPLSNFVKNENGSFYLLIKLK